MPDNVVISHPNTFNVVVGIRLAEKPKAIFVVDARTIY